MDIKNNVKKLFGDSVLSIIGIVFMNAMAQFAIYPFWERTFGTERYGTIVYLLSMMNIAALTFGPAANCTLITMPYTAQTQIKELMHKGLLSKGFNISKEGNLFDDDSLNNRKETVQYYYIFER